MRYHNIGFQWSTLNKKYELVKYDKHNGEEIHYVIAFFDRDNEGYNMRTVGDRFFLDKDAWIVAKCAMHFLGEIFQLENEGEQDARD